MMTASEIRRRFLDYFARQGHEVVPSSPLVPRDDPTLYFTNAGMVQFKKLFLGQEKRAYSRAATSQKCLRISGKHNDLENVGRTARHHTFFEMLGNFSFGDYFKAEAIRYAWEFVTKELGLSKDRLYVTVYTDDDEADELWRTVAGVAPERIFRLGEKDNFWSMGDTGPCGPCSEIYVDQGEQMSCGPDCGIGRCDCDRFLEIWNLVFMQYDQIAPGNRVPLPRPSIDTGMGLERVAAVCQGKTSNFECDLFQELIGFIAALAKVKYGSGDEEQDVALRVIADHSRAAAFLITDGVMPSNEGRAYELRRIIRRALRFGTLIGFTEPFMYKVCEKVAEVMGEAYPDLTENKGFMARVVREEEERFARTLGKGLDILSEELAALAKAKATVVPGQLCFKLYDTFGFPIDIVKDVAEKQGFTVDEKGFTACMAEQKARAREAWKGSGEQDLAGRFAALLETGLSCEFVGYDALTAESKLVAVLDEAGQPVEKLPQGQGGYVVAAKTPFYGESGGQAGDVGAIETMSGAADVLDTLKPAPELHVHKVFVTEGDLGRGQEARLIVDEEARLSTARNHTTTHLLHAALREVLGEHVKQAGSLVGPDRLRFDFTHISALTPQEIAAIEKRVNEAVLAAIPVAREVMSVKAAMERGATALFGEKYGESVCVIEVPGVSMELCGGTHLSNTGQAGPFMIVSESGVAAGVRRIEAATGENALAEIARLRAEAAQAAALLKSRPGEITARITELQAEIKGLRKEREQLQARLLSGAGKSLMDDVREVAGVKLLAARVEGVSVKALREQMDDIRSKMPSGVAALAAPQEDGKVSLILAVSKDLHGRFTAQSLIKDVAAAIGGSGGGRPDMAQAGGTDASGIDKAFAILESLLAKS
ncbi:Alanine-tRNA ligase, eukaryota/bacteria [Alkalidesulfovibrio alkalitolerans DSM 16529]|uniref:Alanine--tRNA ligase n=1 Tax=Alkalidesulfovibrio alkalitolerans DSM 16529 TaxID=1121439 RepID=S7T5W8_9BACT|nr:alanine--tRNA ligase [Alkalidesulfovibrio alkalitolerans]EPR32442.1 Alanine-tRNA ligase, eukaryota/bacteria [Alkalidesulfovibrio alkalitolerans DSM 16529]